MHSNGETRSSSLARGQNIKWQFTNVASPSVSQLGRVGEVTGVTPTAKAAISLVDSSSLHLARSRCLGHLTKRRGQSQITPCSI
uniref:Uncharacterized protein n=1 Tax=Oryza nivara TaxID=4536 RepID=A0A0E0H3P0_ORYNI